MHPARLLSSQELTLHQINVERSYRSREGDGYAFPSTPTSLSAGTASAAASGSRALALASPCSPGGAPIAPTPGGSSSTATASIARPEVRVRAEWASALDDVESFGLPGERFLQRRTEESMVRVRYIADDYDRQWLAQRLGFFGADVGRGGKTGMLGSGTQRGQVRGDAISGGTGGGTSSELGISLFEDLMTAFELSAYYNPEIPLERLAGVDSLYLEDIPATPAIVNDTREYWQRKRESLGGHLPCIPALRVRVREDNQSTLCHPGILGDCPLPFKWRDWAVSIVSRKRGRYEISGKSGNATGGGDTMATTGDDNAVRERHLSITEVALATSVEVLRRERLRKRHAELSLYELAYLRRLEVSTGRIDSSDMCITAAAHDGLTPPVDAVPVSELGTLADLAASALLLSVSNER